MGTRTADRMDLTSIDAFSNVNDRYAPGLADSLSNLANCLTASGSCARLGLISLISMPVPQAFARSDTISSKLSTFWAGDLAKPE